MSRDFFSRLSLVNQLQPSLPGNAGNQVPFSDPSTSVHEGSFPPYYQVLLLTGADQTSCEQAGFWRAAHTPQPAVPRFPRWHRQPWVPRRVACVRPQGAHPDEGNVGADKRRGMAAVVARPNVQHPQRVPLGGLPAVWCSGARSRSLSTNTRASWKMCTSAGPGWTEQFTDQCRGGATRGRSMLRGDGGHRPPHSFG